MGLVAKWQAVVRRTPLRSSMVRILLVRGSFDAEMRDDVIVVFKHAFIMCMLYRHDSSVCLLQRIGQMAGVNEHFWYV